MNLELIGYIHQEAIAFLHFFLENPIWVGLGISYPIVSVNQDERCPQNEELSPYPQAFFTPCHREDDQCGYVYLNVR